MREAPFVDYYHLLEVEPEASFEEIRRSFRRLVLKVHPDKNPRRSRWSERRVRELIHAYEVISDDEKRRLFDREYRIRRRAREESQESRLFFFQKSDPGAIALRILYLLLHGRGKEALSHLQRMESVRGKRFLADELDREDYLDCLFLLGEYHLARKEFVPALERLRSFYLHERSARHPRHYLEAVVDHLKDLYLRYLPRALPASRALEILGGALDLEWNQRERQALDGVRVRLKASASR